MKTDGRAGYSCKTTDGKVLASSPRAGGNNAICTTVDQVPQIKFLASVLNVFEGPIENLQKIQPLNGITYTISR